MSSIMEGEAQCTGTRRKEGKLYKTSVCWQATVILDIPVKTTGDK